MHFKREKRAGTYLFFRDVAIQVSSAQTSLTSVFGMGTGGSSSSSAPAVLRTAFATHSLYSLLFSRLHSHVPSKLNTEVRFANFVQFELVQTAETFLKFRLGKCRTVSKNCGQALVLLVHAGSMRHRTYTLCLSTS